MTEKKLKVLDLDTPPEIVIKPSQVEPHKYGIWCKQLIKEGSKFGPFVGEKAYEVDETMDPAFIWEIVDVETKEFLFYINATNPRYGNWMRHINCARFFEEQNIVSEQEGIDIYYHAIKDIQPGDELLTWYEKSPVRKKKGKKKIFPNVKRARTGDESKVASKSSDYDSVSLRGRKRTARKFWEMEEVGMRVAAIDCQSGSDDELSNNNANNDDDEDDEDWDAPKYSGPLVAAISKPRNSPATATNSASALVASATSSGRNSPVSESSRGLTHATEATVALVDKEKPATVENSGPVFNFETMVEQGGNGGSNSSTGGSWKNGRRVFRCDICSGVYRHSFSLKRHYVRCHINYKYLTRVDIIQCGVQPPKNLNINLEEDDTINEDEEESTNQINPDAKNIDTAATTLADISTAATDQIKSEDDLSDSSRNGESQKTVEMSQVIREGTADQDTKQVKVETAPMPTAAVSKESSATGVSIISSSFKNIAMPDLYRCNICEQFFHTKEEIRYHLANHPESENGEQRQFSCSHCKMQFKHRQNLVRHEVVHTGAKPFSCQQCHKSFPTATNQKRHERIHDGHRLTCDLCPATFTQTGDLKKHASKQHPESYNECAYCSKYFSSESVLDMHLKKIHGKDAEANRRKACVKKKAKKVLLEKDRAESRRFAVEEAEKHPGKRELEESYACTVCKKCFPNYSNMCRHRRLAHYKDSKNDDFYTNGDDDEEIARVTGSGNGCPHQQQSSHSQNYQQNHNSTGVSTRSSDAVCIETGYKHFLTVARNVSKNLEQFIEGTQQDLINASSHIKWRDPMWKNDLSENDSRDEGHSSLDMSFTMETDICLENYNFPKGYQIPMKRSSSNDATSEESALGDITEQYVSEESNNPQLLCKTHFSKICEHCQMNFADEKGYTGHALACLPPTKTEVKPPEESPFELFKNSDTITAIHDYSQKPKPREQALKYFPELAKLPTNLYSDEAILDLSRHKECIHTNYHVDSPLRLPCLVSLDEPLDLTGSSPNKESTWITSDNNLIVPSPSISTILPPNSSFLASTPNSSPSLDCEKPPRVASEFDHSFQSPHSFNTTMVAPFPTLTGSPTRTREVEANDKTPSKKIICMVCFQEFQDREAVLDHQENTHNNVDCRLAEIEPDFKISWPTAPKSHGLLNSSDGVLDDGVLDDGVLEDGVLDDVVLDRVLDDDANNALDDTPVEVDLPVEVEEYKAGSPEGEHQQEELELPQEEQNQQEHQEQRHKQEEQLQQQEREDMTVVTGDSPQQQQQQRGLTELEQAEVVDENFGVVDENFGVVEQHDEGVTCTKCHQNFVDLASLHNHISEMCGDYWRSLNERVSYIFVLRGSRIQPEPEPTITSNTPKKRGKFKWQQQTGTSNGAPGSQIKPTNFGDDGSKRQLQSASGSGRGNVAAAAVDASRKTTSNKVLTRKRSQETGAAVMSAMDDPDYYVRSKRRAIAQQQNAAGTLPSAGTNSRKNRRQISCDASKDGAPDVNDPNMASSSLEEETLAYLSSEFGDNSFNNNNNNNDDDDDDYDPNKFMCIYCRHQFQYTRTLRKHVLEFCHVRRDYAEKGEDLDLEWEEELASKVQPVTPSTTELPEETDESKKGGGRRRRKKNWCTRSYSNSSNKQTNNNNNSSIKAPERQHKQLPVQLQLHNTISDEHVHRLHGTRGESNVVAKPVLARTTFTSATPSMTKGGTILINAQENKTDDVDLIVSCDSIPNENLEEIEIENFRNDKSIYGNSSNHETVAGTATAVTTTATHVATAAPPILPSVDSFIHVEIYTTAPQAFSTTSISLQQPQKLILQQQLLLHPQQLLEPQPAQQQQQQLAQQQFRLPQVPSFVVPSTSGQMTPEKQTDNSYQEDDEDDEEEEEEEYDNSGNSGSSTGLMMTVSCSPEDLKSNLQDLSAKDDRSKVNRKRRGPRLTMVRRKKKAPSSHTPTPTPKTLPSEPSGGGSRDAP